MHPSSRTARLVVVGSLGILGFLRVVRRASGFSPQEGGKPVVSKRQVRVVGLWLAVATAVAALLQALAQLAGVVMTLIAHH